MRSYSRLTASQSKKFIERKNARLILAIGLSIFSLVLWTYCFSKLSYLEAFNVSNIEVVGADPSTSNTLKAAAMDTLSGSYFGLFSKSNIFIYPKQSLMETLKTLSPRILAASVNSMGFQGLTISVTEKVPAALVCVTLPDFSDGNLSLNNTDNCYFADWTGYLFEKASLSASSTFNRYYIPALADLATSTSPIIGMLATSTPAFRDLQEFYDGARRADLSPLAILVKDAGEYEMYIGNVVIYFNNFRALNEQLLNLISFWDKKVRGKERQSRFETINVKYGSNVIYREIK